MRLMACVLVSACSCLQVAAAEDNPFDGLNLETHGFASFGYIRAWGDDWVAGSAGGTSEFWEAAVNVISRPIDRLRLGAQIFARDVGDFDNGKPQLDWAYADWRAADSLGLQVGRVQVAIGLYNEIRDIDAARTSVFLPVSIYSLRSRDLFVSTDGGKLYGFADLHSAGSLEYQLFAGKKHLDPELGFATYFIKTGLGTQIDSLGLDGSAGAMVHWNTPVEGLALRVTATETHGLTVEASTPSLGYSSTLSVDQYRLGILSIQYEHGDWTFASEYERFNGEGEIRIEPFGISQRYSDNSEDAYVSATWHQRPWLEWYAAVEASWESLSNRRHGYLYSTVLAGHVMPARNWSLKAEFRDNWRSALVADGDDERFQVLALKTTVDF